MKLSKTQIRDHKKAEEILAQDTLTYEDKIFVYNNWYPSYNNQIGAIGSFFTPYELAKDFNIEVAGDRILDLCAGIGMLSFIYYHHNNYYNNNIEIVCIERNPEFVAVGKKLFPEATWICGDVLDEEIYKNLGTFDCVIGNPPFGKIKSTTSTNWLQYKGSEFEYKSMEIGAKMSKRGVYIIPQNSAPFKYSGNNGFRVNISKKYLKFVKETGLTLSANCGIDTDVFKTEWKGASPTVEIVVVNLDEPSEYHLD